MIEVRRWQDARAERFRGSHIESFAGQRRYKCRILFPTDRETLRDRNVPLSLGERLRIERWLKQ